MSWGEIKKAVNSDLSKPLNELIGTKREYDTPGTYTLTATTNTLGLTQACAGGGGGYYNTNQGGCGGGGGQAVVNHLLSVTQGETITITIGTGGTGGSPAGPAGTNGDNTTISGSVSGTLLTLQGGYGATSSTVGGAAGGAGGGAGGGQYAKGLNGILGSGGAVGTFNGGSGGGGSIGNGGNGGGVSGLPATNGVKGGGGGGGGSGTGAATGNGGNGYVLIMTGIYDYIKKTSYSLTPKFLSGTAAIGQQTLFEIGGSGVVNWIWVRGGGMAASLANDTNFTVDGTVFSIAAKSIATNTNYVIGDTPILDTSFYKFNVHALTTPTIPAFYLAPIPFKNSFAFNANVTGGLISWGVSYSLKEV